MLVVEVIRAVATQEPNCVEASVSSSGDSVVIRVEREFQVELVAETKVFVIVSPYGPNDFDDKHVDFDDNGDGDFEDLDADLLEDELD